MSDASNPSQSGLPVGTQALPEALGGEAPAQAGQAPAQGQPPATEPAATSPNVLLDAPAENVTPNPDTSQEFSYDPTGDAGLDYALNFVGKLGYGDTHPATPLVASSARIREKSPFCAAMMAGCVSP